MKERLNQPGKIVVFSKEKIGKEIINGEDVNCKGIYFRECEFEDDIFFKKVNLNCGVVFDNCRSSNIICFSRCIAKSTDRDLTGFETSNLLVKNCIFNNLIIDKQSEFNYGIRILKGTELQELNISRLYSEKGSVFINESIIHSRLYFIRSKVTSGIRLNRSVVEGSIKYENIIASSFSFTKTHIKGNVFLWGSNVDTITFNEGIYDDEFHIDAVKCRKLLTSIGDNFNKGIDIRYNDDTNGRRGGPNKYYIQSLKSNGIFNVNGSNNPIEPFPINEILIKSSLPLSGQIVFKNLAVEVLQITGTSKDVDLLFDYCQFKNVKLIDLINFGNLRFQNIKAIKGESLFLIQNTNLGKAHFFNFFFNTFSEVRIYDTILSDIYTSRVRWFYNINRSIDSRTQIDFDQVRDIYRQLKLSMEKQGDRINSIHFKKHEMNAYYQSLSLRNNFWDVLMMWLNKSNNYGTTWIKPILWLLSLGFVTYWLMLFITTEELILAPASSVEELSYCINLIKENIHIYPQILNPLNSLDKLFDEGDTTSFSFYFISFLWKIAVAYLAFQTISAFRKYVGK